MSYAPFRGVATAIALATPLFVTSPTLAQIDWRGTAPHVDIVQEPASIVQTIAATIADGKRHVIVRLESAATGDERARLAELGVELLDWLGDGAYFARLHDGANPAAIAAHGAVRAASTIDPMHRMHPDLVGGGTPDHAIVGMTRDRSEHVVGAYVVMQRGVALDDGIGLVDAVGGAVRDRLETINGLVIEVPRSGLDTLATEDAVQWIEPPLPRMSTTNAENRAITQVDLAHSAPYNLDGTGVTALIYDGGAALASHSDFSGRLTVIDGDGTSNHATHVAGTVGGDGSITFNNRGMAPNTTLLSAGFEYDGSGTFLYTNPGDIEQDYGNGINQGASLANNSIGSNVESNGFPCSYQGDYGVTASVIDGIARGSLGETIIIMWANGNERQGSGCDIEGYGDYYSIAPPAGAKNHITVGALNADTDFMTSFSSWGPTDDGRMKPDVSAPGCQQGGDGGVTSCSSSGGYTVFCGTSMASPTACGIGALILQDYRVQFPGQPDPLPSTMKVLLAHTAFDRGNPGPDYQYGYGSIRAEDAIQFMRTAQFLESSVAQGQTQSYSIDIPFAAPEIRATLAWDDAPGTPNVNPNLVNDLDVRLIDPVGGIHYPWTLDPLDPDADAVRTGPNTLDNIEQVYVLAPMSGTWTLEVTGTSVPDGPQTFSLAAYPELDISFTSIAVTDTVPELVAPGDSLDLTVQISTVNDTVVPGSEALHYRFGGGAYTTVSLTPSGGDFVATIPGANCDDTPEFYVSAEGASSGVVSDPPGGAGNPYSYSIGEFEIAHYDDMETDPGWTVTNGGGLSDGAWDRGVPAGGGDRGDPPTDGDGSGQCWLTDNVDGNSDVDNGFTTLTSPTLDASGDNMVVSYHRWFSNDTGGGPNTDTFVVEVSDDNGGSWTELETVGPSGEGTSGGWIEASYALDDVPGFTSNDQFRIRFTAEDVGEQSVTEAGVDGLQLSRSGCEDTSDPCPTDFNDDDVTDVSDLLAFLGAWGACGACPEDLNGDGVVDVADMLELLAAWGPCP